MADIYEYDADPPPGDMTYDQAEQADQGYTKEDNEINATGGGYGAGSLIRG